MSSLGGIVITGASTGIGRASAVALAEHGFRVFGGVRTQDSAEELSSRHEKLTPLFLDVTRGDQISAAAVTVRDRLQGEPLAGLMNNAGIFLAGPLEFLTPEDLRRQLEVNVVGMVAVTQAFLPQLRESAGRLVLTGSVSGILTTPLVGGYCLSKAAVESMADSFRQELRTAGIQVSLLQLGAIETPMWDKTEYEAQAFVEAAAPTLRERYGPLIDKVMAMNEDYRSQAVSADEAAQTAVRAFTARHPKARYLMGGNALPQLWISALPSRWRDAVMRGILRRFS